MNLNAVTDVRHFSGFAVTGTNKNFGKQLWDFGGDVGAFSFDFVFGFNPEGESSFAITEETPMDTLMATGVDPTYLAFFGQTPDDIDPALINIPLRQVRVEAGPAGVRTRLPLLQDTQAGQAGIALPNDPITLGQWLEAEGEAKSTCYEDGNSFVEVRFKGLIPNGLYTVWINFAIDTNVDGVDDRVGGAPLGGVPNVVVAGRDGKAIFERELNFCIQHEKKIKILNLAYHSDHAVFGASPDLPMLGLPGGTTIHAAVNFPLNIE